MMLQSSTTSLPSTLGRWFARSLLAVTILAGAPVTAQEAPATPEHAPTLAEAKSKMRDVSHPFILWTADEAAALRKRIETDADAKKQYEKMQKLFGPGGVKARDETMWDLFQYSVMGDEAAGQRQKGKLLSFIGTKPDPMTWDVDPATLKWNEGMPSSGDRHMRDEQTENALRYDVLYDLLSDKEREGVEKAMRDYIYFHVEGHKPWHPAFKYDRTSWLPNMHWPRAIGTHVLAVALKDPDAIDAVFNSQGGFRFFIAEYLADGQFYMEEFGKYYSNVGTMIMYCEGLHRLGLDGYGYGYTGPNGGTMQRFLEMTPAIGYPRTELPGGGMPRYDVIEMGDAGTAPLVPGGDNDLRWYSDSHMNGVMSKMHHPLWYEAGEKRFPDAGFAYFLYQMRAPGEEVYYPTLYFGLGPITKADAVAPAAPSYITRERGFALLRANETPAYWESPDPAVALQFGMYYVHYVHDCFSILGYNAFNRTLYTRSGGAQKGYSGGAPWEDSVRGHSGVVVDGLQAKPVDDGNTGTQNEAIREYLSGPAKFVSVRAEGIYPDIDMERSLVLTKEYLFDVFWNNALDDEKHTYDWQVLSPGFVVGKDDKRWQATDELYGGVLYKEPKFQEKLAKKPTMADMSDVKKFTPDGKGPWEVSVIQRVGEDSEVSKAWNERQVGVTASMLPEVAGVSTTVFASKPPGIGTNDRGASIMVRREAASTVFVALHQPFEGGSDAGPIASWSRIAQTDAGVAVRIDGKGDGFSDRIALRYAAAGDEPVMLAGEGESFTVGDFAHIRVADGQVRVTGDLKAMKLKVSGNPKLVVNGEAAKATVDGGTMSYPAP